jgi:hypothetical protein
MKSLLISALFFLQFAASAQIYIPLKVVNGIATFETSAEVKNLSAEEIHTRSTAWIKKTFLNEPVITQDLPTRIAARYMQEYSKDAWSDSFQHNLQIDIQDGKVVFTITDTGLSLVRDGAFKENLTKIRIMFEQSANELFWSYQEDLNQVPDKK